MIQSASVSLPAVVTDHIMSLYADGGEGVSKRMAVTGKVLSDICSRVQFLT